MENQSNLQEPLLPLHNTSLGHQQKDVIKRKKLRRSRSAPIIVCIPKDVDSNAPVAPPEPRFPRLHPSVRRVTAYLSIYFGIGAICFYMITDQLSGKKTTPIVDALYFCVVTMTTVGYGDLVPRTAVSKILACAFVFSGMALIVLVLSKAADYLVEKQEGLIKSARRMRRKFRPDDILKEIETKKVKHKCIVTSIVLFLLHLTGITFLIFIEKLDFLDAFYTVCVTMTSLGYGDHSFSTKRGRIFAVVWILTSTICVAQLFLYLAELNTERRQNDLIKWVLSRRVTIVDLEHADIDHDGVVNAAEFVLYKLKQMKKINQADVLRVLKEFEELDVNQAGSLSIFDLTFAD